MPLYLLLFTIFITGFLNIFLKSNKLLRIISLIGILPIILDVLLNIYSSDSYFTSLVYFSDINLVMQFLFITIMTSGVLFLLLHKEINFKELGVIFFYFGAGIAVIKVNNFLELFIFWELLTITGAVIITFGKKFRIQYVSIKYFVIHSIGAMMLLIGICGYYLKTGSLLLPDKRLELNSIHNYLILFGIMINLGLPPFSSWLLDAYSRCSPIAAIFLSVFTTKAALLIVIKLFYGFDILVYLGIFLALYSIMFSMIEYNLRRLLGLSIIHQIGITLIAAAYVDISLDSLISIYIFNGVLYKLILFMIVSIILNNHTTTNLHTLKGIIPIKSFLGVMLVIVALSAFGFPLTAAYITKFYVFDNITSSSQYLVILLTFIMSAVALNVGIKIPYKLLNFTKNPKTLMFSKYKIPIFITIVLIMQLIFNTLNTINNPEIYSISNMFHVLITIFLGVLILSISNLIFVNIYSGILNGINRIKRSTLLFTRLLITNMITTKLKIPSSILRIPRILDNKYIYEKMYTSTNLLGALLVTIVLVYILLRYSY